MRGLSYSANKERVIVAIAEILHGDDYLGLWGATPVNLEVQLHKNRRSVIGHSGTGRFTIAVPSVAFRFLEEYGGEPPLKVVRFAERQLFFKPSNNRPRDDIVQRLRYTPYPDPHVQAEEQRGITEMVGLT